MEITNKHIFYAILPITVIFSFMALGQASTLFLWFICAFFLFAVIDPWMHRFEGRGVPTLLVSLGLVVAAVAVLGGMGFLIYKTSSGIIVQLVSYKDAIFKYYEKVNHFVSQYTQMASSGDASHSSSGAEQVSSVLSNASQAANSVSGSQAAVDTAAQNTSSAPHVSTNEVGKGVLSGLTSVLNILTYLTLTPLLTFFMLAERNLFGSVAQRYFREPNQGRMMWKKITDAITGFFLGNLILILVSFPIFILAFWLLGVKAFLSLGLLSAICNLVPFLGFVLAAVLPTLDLMLNGGHLGGALGLIGLCFVTHFTVANVVTPKLIGARLNVNATVSTIALIGWGELWGPIGLLLAIPITAIIKILMENSRIEMFRALAELMSEDQNVSEQMRFKKQKKASGLEP